MVPSIQVGLFHVEPVVTNLAARIFDLDRALMPPISDDKAALDFLDGLGRPSGKVLIMGANSPFSKGTFRKRIKDALNDPMFHVVLNETDDTTQLSIANHPQTHLVSFGDELQINDLSHHLYGIKESITALWQNAKIFDILAEYEETYIGESDHASRIKRFLQKLCLLVAAQSVHVYTLNEEGNKFVRQFGVGAKAADIISRKPIERAFGLKDVCWSYAVSNDLKPALSLKKPFDAAIISVFNLQMVPGLIVYTFESSIDQYGVLAICQVGSRETFHLLRAKQMRSRYECLKDLARIANFANAKRDIMLHIIERLMKHFPAEGISIVERNIDESGSVGFKKTYLHWQYLDQDWFPAGKGFADYCVTNNRALLIQKTEPNSQPPYGDGLYFDPNNLSLGAGKPIRLETIIAPNTALNEESLMYFPLRHGNRTLGAFKVGDFKRSNAFNLHHLRDLAAFSDLVAITLWNLQRLEQLQQDVENLKIQEKMVQTAETLWFYRDIAQGVFHQATNHLNKLFSSLQTAEMLAEQKETVVSDLRSIISKNLALARNAKELIGDAQKRGTTLVPYSQKCLLVQDVLRPAVEYARRKTEDDQNIRIEHAFTSKDYHVVLDKDLAKESFINLLNNAIWAVKANTSSNKKQIFVAVRESPKDGMIHIIIRDSGIGIEHRYLSKLFTKFFTTRDNAGGTGLGLYFAKMIMEKFGGNVKIARTFPGQGTTVLISIPQMEAAK